VVVVFYGDGSVVPAAASPCRPPQGYSIMEFDTYVRHKIPILAIVGNDACWTQIAREQARLYARRAPSRMTGPALQVFRGVRSGLSTIARPLTVTQAFSDYHKAVEAFGAKGFLIDTEDVRAARRAP
jgi:thiamine pyrophosphate-dependent acetolactate synthase large subunit-like protein